MLLLAGCSLLQACGIDDLDYAAGTLERDRIHLAADSSEPVVAIVVREGDVVAAGAILLRQDPAKILAALTRARSERDAALAQLREAQNGPRVQEIEQARSTLTAAQTALRVARLELERQQSLVEKNYTSASTVDILEGRVDEAQAQQEAAAAALEMLQEGTRSEIIDSAKSRVAALDATVAELELTLARTRITAPVDGVIESLPFELGERPTPGQTLVVVLASGRTYARVHVPEPLRTRLHSGDAALVRIDGYAEAFPARIRWISADAAFTPYFALTQRDRSRLAYLAEIDLLEAGDLPAGIPVEVRFPDLALQ
jgi:HlyD family secretion protein